MELLYAMVATNTFIKMECKNGVGLMAIYRQIHISFWQDPFVLTLTPEEKYFYLYLMTNSKTSQCGVYELPKSVIVFETGYNQDTVEKLLGKFVDYCKILYAENTKEIFILNWLKYNSFKSPKVRQCIDEEIKKIKTLSFRDGLLHRLSIDSGEEKEKEEEKEEKPEEEKEEKKSRNKIPPPLEDVKVYCEERKNGIDPQYFIDYYSARGWMLNKNKIKDWQACIRTWEKNNGGKNGANQRNQLNTGPAATKNQSSPGNFSEYDKV